MRSYTIVAGSQTWTSQLNGAWNPNALDVMIDLQVAAYGATQGNSFVRVWGLPLQTLLGARQFNGQPITITGGMTKGLPLANTQPAPGVLAAGIVYQAFGNWVGEEQSLDMIIIPADGATSAKPAQITLNWLKGQPLGPALQSTLQSAFPDLTVTVNISPNLVAPEDAPAQYGTLQSLSQYVFDTSKSIITTSGYLGVQIVPINKTLVVFDGTQGQAATTTLAFTDLIGQPLWHGPNQIQVFTMMRSDIAVGQQIKLPQTLATTTASAQTQAQPLGLSQGPFSVTSVRHVGRFRSPQAEGWLSVFDCYSTAGTQPS